MPQSIIERHYRTAYHKEKIFEVAEAQSMMTSDPWRPLGRLKTEAKLVLPRDIMQRKQTPIFFGCVFIFLLLCSFNWFCFWSKVFRIWPFIFILPNFFVLLRRHESNLNSFAGPLFNLQHMMNSWGKTTKHREWRQRGDKATKTEDKTEWKEKYVRSHEPFYAQASPNGKQGPGILNL